HEHDTLRSKDTPNLREEPPPIRSTIQRLRHQDEIEATLGHAKLEQRTRTENHRLSRNAVMTQHRRPQRLQKVLRALDRVDPLHAPRTDQLGHPPQPPGGSTAPPPRNRPPPNPLSNPDRPTHLIEQAALPPVPLDRLEIALADPQLRLELALSHGQDKQL